MRLVAVHDIRSWLFPPPSSGEVAASYADGGVMSIATGAHDPSVADYRATSPEDGGGELLSNCPAGALAICVCRPGVPIRT